MKPSHPSAFCFFTLAGALVFATAALAQETDVTQTPNAANAGIKKSYTEQIGQGRGDVLTPDSSAFIIARDPARAIVRGRQIFQRKFTGDQGIGPRTNDGVGDIMTDGSHGAGLSDSCASCHGRPQGAAGFGGDVFTRPTSRDAPHLFGLGLVEMLGDEITGDLRAQRDQAALDAVNSGSPVVAFLTSKGVKYGSLTAFSDGSVDSTLVEGVDADLRVRPFFAQGGTISIREFVVGAFNAEMGLESGDPDLNAAAGGGAITTPSGMVLDGALDSIERPVATDAFDDPDLDGIVDEIPESIVDFTEFYLLNYFRPAVRVQADDDDESFSGGGSLGQSQGSLGGREVNDESKGRRIFDKIGCAVCHVADLQIDIDRRVADTSTFLDRENGNSFNNLYTTATVQFTEVDDGSGFPTLKQASGLPFLVEDIFADFKRHDIGPGFWERNFDNSVQKEFVTEPLWGVGSTAPYGHDGRSPSLADVILRHGGEAQAARDKFDGLNESKQDELIGFLQTLVLFGPPSTASNLDPVDKAQLDYPLNGHGSIDLGALFNDPLDKE
ncbi:MAG: hypothetical protein ACI8QS_001653 [Planctomycetota bacterium]|jgi:hypothetical protein